MWRPVLNTFSFAVDDVQEEDTRLTQEEEEEFGFCVLMRNLDRNKTVFIYISQSLLYVGPTVDLFIIDQPTTTNHWIKSFICSGPLFLRGRNPHKSGYEEEGNSFQSTVWWYQNNNKYFLLLLLPLWLFNSGGGDTAAVAFKLWDILIFLRK